QLVVAGRYSGAGDVEGKLTGNVGGREQTFSYKLHFDDRKTTGDYVPRLWATRRVGFLLDEIRIHGETAELRDETTELARKYGIVTPYTAYLIRSEEHTSELQSLAYLVCRLLLEKKKKINRY